VNTTDSAVRSRICRPASSCRCRTRNRSSRTRTRRCACCARASTSASSSASAQELDATRRSQIGTGERAEKIRTYNYPENRLTDHRIKLTAHQLDRILQGELDEFTDALAAEEQRRALSA
jgi:Protein chain release factor A